MWGKVILKWKVMCVLERWVCYGDVEEEIVVCGWRQSKISHCPCPTLLPLSVAAPAPPSPAHSGPNLVLEHS